MEMQFLILGTHNIDRQEIANALAMIIEARAALELSDASCGIGI